MRTQPTTLLDILRNHLMDVIFISFIDPDDTDYGDFEKQKCLKINVNSEICLFFS